MSEQAPPPFDQAWIKAHGWPAFSTGHEGETWQNGWCGTCRFSSDGEGCTLSDVAILGRTPAQWETRVPGGLITRYECTVYRPADPDVDVRTHVASLPNWPSRADATPGPSEAHDA
jgi:hypothetical protein